MGFKANWSEAAQPDSLKPEGDYECLIAKAEERDYTNSKGEEKTCLNISFVIRNDVEQGYKNGYIFHTLWKRIEPTENDMQVNGYGFNQVMALGKAAGLPDGKDYDSLEQFLGELVKKPVRVTVKHGEWNGKKKRRSQLAQSYKVSDSKAYLQTVAERHGNSLCTATAELCTCTDSKSGL